jgi:hypothetical protein
VTAADVAYWNTAYGWGDHATDGYLKTETDPAFTASPAAAIGSASLENSGHGAPPQWRSHWACPSRALEAARCTGGPSSNRSLRA